MYGSKFIANDEEVRLHMKVLYDKMGSQVSFTSYITKLTDDWNDSLEIFKWPIYRRLVNYLTY